MGQPSLQFCYHTHPSSQKTVGSYPIVVLHVCFISFWLLGWWISIYSHLPQGFFFLPAAPRTTAACYLPHCAYTTHRAIPLATTVPPFTTPPPALPTCLPACSAAVFYYQPVCL